MPLISKQQVHIRICLAMLACIQLERRPFRLKAHMADWRNELARIHYFIRRTERDGRRRLVENGHSERVDCLGLLEV